MAEKGFADRVIDAGNAFIEKHTKGARLFAERDPLPVLEQFHKALEDAGLDVTTLDSLRGRSFTLDMKFRGEFWRNIYTGTITGASLHNRKQEGVSLLLSMSIEAHDWRGSSSSEVYFDCARPEQGWKIRISGAEYEVEFSLL